MRTADFDYALPRELIAQHPPAVRDGGRMLVLDPQKDVLTHAGVRDLPAFLQAGDLLVFNDTRVLPARLKGERDGGGAAEVLLLRPLRDDPATWEALVRPGRRLRPGATVTFPGSPLQATVLGNEDGESRRVRLAGSADILAEVRRIGRMPTPPYIKEPLSDGERYQTVYARREGSAAAPTAGLHFTPELLAAVRDRGTSITFVTLHVGQDTFAPVRSSDPAAHPIHREFFQLSPETADAIAVARAGGGRVIAIGTTCVRVLESCGQDGTVRPQEGWTDLFILPGFKFQVVDGLLTNFHLPKSTLLMLVSAFAGRDRILSAYREAISHGYRFYSFGDCMLITGRPLTAGRSASAR